MTNNSKKPQELGGLKEQSIISHSHHCPPQVCWGWDDRAAPILTVWKLLQHKESPGVPHTGNYMLWLRSNMSFLLANHWPELVIWSHPTPRDQAVPSAGRGERGKLGQTSQITAMEAVAGRGGETHRKSLRTLCSIPYLSLCLFANVSPSLKYWRLYRRQ